MHRGVRGAFKQMHAAGSAGGVCSVRIDIELPP
jgi:hypothetical protein